MVIVENNPYTLTPEPDTLNPRMKCNRHNRIEVCRGDLRGSDDPLYHRLWRCHSSTNPPPLI